MGDNNEIEENNPIETPKKQKWNFTQYFMLGVLTLIASHIIFILGFLNGQISLAMVLTVGVLFQWFYVSPLLFIGFIALFFTKENNFAGFLLGIAACSGVTFILSLILCGVQLIK